MIKTPELPKVESKKEKRYFDHKGQQGRHKSAGGLLQSYCDAVSEILKMAMTPAEMA